MTQDYKIVRFGINNREIETEIVKTWGEPLRVESISRVADDIRKNGLIASIAAKNLLRLECGECGNDYHSLNLAFFREQVTVLLCRHCGNFEAVPHFSIILEKARYDMRE